MRTTSPFRSVLLTILVPALAAGAAAARAAALDDFRAFTTQVKSARGDFQQRVVDRTGKVLRQSSGTFALARPGRFRWSYVKPFDQLVVGDGQKVWIWDADLNQVTIRKMDETLSATPAALLSGAQDFERVFTIEEGAPAEGLVWIVAKPKAADSGVESARLGFGKGGTLERLEFTDSFGQQTQVTLARFERNPALPPDTFRFVPPRGADVIGGP